LEEPRSAKHKDNEYNRKRKQLRSALVLLAEVVKHVNTHNVLDEKGSQFYTHFIWSGTKNSEKQKGKLYGKLRGLDIRFTLPQVLDYEYKTC
jgi:hypothetical protein